MTTRQRAIEATIILNDFIGDIIVGSRSIELFEKAIKGKSISNGTCVSIARLCYFHLILLLAKWVEFYDKYHSVIPNDLKNECKKLYKEIRKRKVQKFRNKYVGHIWDKDSKAPLTTNDVNQFMDEITKGDRKEFLLWLNNSANNSYPNTIVSIVSEVRNRIRDDNILKEEEVFTTSYE